VSSSFNSVIGPGRRRRYGGKVVGGLGSGATVTLPTLHESQRKVVRERARFNVLECGRRWGKDILAEERTLRPAVKKGLPVGWFAPTYKLLKPNWRHVQKLLGGMVEDGGMIKDKSEQEKRLELVGGGVIEFWSLEDEDAGRGRDYARAIVNEAGLVRDLSGRWNAAIRPTLSILHGDAWFFGTPKGRKYFHTLYEKGQAQMDDEDGGRWASWRLGSILNPLMDPVELREAQRDMPPDVFKQEYLGEPAEDGGNPFGVKAIQRCTMPEHTCTASQTFELPPNFIKHRRYAAGVDLARAEDYTVNLTLDVDSGTTVFLDRYHHPWEVTEPRLIESLKKYRAHYSIDATGSGDKVSNDIIKGTGPGVPGVRFEFSGPTKQALMERLMVALHKSEVMYPAGWLVAELEGFGYEYTKTGVRYEAAQGLHDDGVIALALAIHARDHYAITENGADSSKWKTARK
jgi:hypothetical protein